MDSEKPDVEKKAAPTEDELAQHLEDRLRNKTRDAEVDDVVPKIEADPDKLSVLDLNSYEATEDSGNARSFIEKPKSAANGHSKYF